MTPNEHRAKHKRCRTCEYLFSVRLHTYKKTSCYCMAKEKSVLCIGGKFRKVYKPKEFKE